MHPNFLNADKKFLDNDKYFCFHTSVAIVPNDFLEILHFPTYICDWVLELAYLAVDRQFSKL